MKNTAATGDKPAELSPRKSGDARKPYRKPKAETRGKIKPSLLGSPPPPP